MNLRCSFKCVLPVLTAVLLGCRFGNALSKAEAHKELVEGDLELEKKTYEIHFELRVPKTLTIEPSTEFGVTTDENTGREFLERQHRREEGGDTIFHCSDLIYSGQKRRAIMVTVKGKPTLVFPLVLPRVLKPTTWTSWVRPSYSGESDADVQWNYMYGLKQKGLSTNIPPQTFELRYMLKKAPRYTPSLKEMGR